nr:uncharacterized protein LOC127303810 [Lolium perenne]
MGEPLLLLILSPPHLTTPPLCLAADGIERPCSSAAPFDLRRGLLATPLTALPRRSRRGALASRTDSPRHLLLHGLPSHLLPHSCRPPPVALRSPPPFTCLDADQDACFHLDSLSSSSRPRRTTPIGALVAAALGHVSGNRRRGRQVFFHEFEGTRPVSRETRWNNFLPARLGGCLCACVRFPSAPHQGSCISTRILKKYVTGAWCLLNLRLSKDWTQWGRRLASEPSPKWVSDNSYPTNVPLIWYVKGYAVSSDPYQSQYMFMVYRNVAGD